jgi:hypothetical protein
MHELTVDYKPVLLSWIADCDAETQVLLRPAVDIALDAIERLCSPVYSDAAEIIEVSAGRRIERVGNYGPVDIASDEFVVFLRALQKVGDGLRGRSGLNRIPCRQERQPRSTAQSRQRFTNASTDHEHCLRSCGCWSLAGGLN